MSVMGVWIVGAIPDAEACDLVRRFSGAATGRAFPHSASFAWWKGGGDQEPFFERTPRWGSLWSTEAAERFAGLFDGTDSDEADELWEICLGLVSDGEPEGLLAATARKASPVAALFHGLGASRSCLLPGAFGTFLLTNREVEDVLPDVEQAFRLDRDERDRVLQRIGAWMDGMGDAPGFDAAELVDGPLRVLRHAAATGQGVAALSHWY